VAFGPTGPRNRQAAPRTRHDFLQARNQKRGAFIGYSHFHQVMNALGRVELANPLSDCAGSAALPTSMSSSQRQIPEILCASGLPAMSHYIRSPETQRGCRLPAVSDISRDRRSLAFHTPLKSFSSRRTTATAFSLRECRRRSPHFALREQPTLLLPAVRVCTTLQQVSASASDSHLQS
jgi:hypothetical protein